MIYDSKQITETERVRVQDTEENIRTEEGCITDGRSKVSNEKLSKLHSKYMYWTDDESTQDLAGRVRRKEATRKK